MPQAVLLLRSWPMELWLPGAIEKMVVTAPESNATSCTCRLYPDASQGKSSSPGSWFAFNITTGLTMNSGSIAGTQIARIGFKNAAAPMKQPTWIYQYDVNILWNSDEFRGFFLRAWTQVPVLGVLRILVVAKHMSNTKSLVMFFFLCVRCTPLILSYIQYNIRAKCTGSYR